MTRYRPFDSRISLWKIFCSTLLLFAATGAMFVGCPAPIPVEEPPPTVDDASTIWKGETIASEDTPDQPGNSENLEPPPQLTFEQITLDKSIPLQRVGFLEGNGIAVGDGIFSSSNVGDSWDSVAPEPWIGTLYSLAIHPETKKALAVGGTTTTEPRRGLLVMSTNAGVSWQVALILKEEGKDFRFRTAVWVTPLIALAAGDKGLLYHTRDGGKTWSPLDSFSEKDKQLSWYDMTFVDGKLFLVGEEGSLLMSETNGTSWTVLQQKEGTPTLRSIHFIDAVTGITVGDEGLALVTYNGGLTWAPIEDFTPLPDDNSLHTVTSNGSNFFLIAAGRDFWISKNRGRTWRSNGVFASELPSKHSLTGASFSSEKIFFFSTTYGILLKATLQ